MKRIRPMLAAALCASYAIFTTALAATVGTFTGGDPGEGLDLQGNFLYAVNAGPSGAAGPVGDANFTADNVTGVSITANNSIGTGGWGAVNYGDTANDKNLSTVMASIRWAAAPTVVTTKLRVEQGVEYKLQLLFHEDCCPNRGYNIIINGKTEITNFMPGPAQAGDQDFNETKNRIGSVVTHQFVSQSDELEIILDGPSADGEGIGDRNAILNGFTVERISAVADSDNDGLRDDWERKYFPDLAQNGSGDPDQDTLSNAAELTAGTDPSNADSDGDGLSDGAEINTHKSNPLLRDTDGDGLADGAEINTYATSPTNTDSDGDTFPDGEEVRLGTDPADKNSKSVLTQVGVIKGGDAGDGLDLDGNFIYALAIGAPPEAAVSVRDANFLPLTESEVDGATIEAGHMINNWYQVNYGESENDMNLAIATSSIRWSNAADAERPQIIVTLANLEIGAQYKVQLMFGEQCCNRAFDVFFDDSLVVKDLNPGVIHGGINNRTQEALLTRIHFAKATTLVIRLDGRQATTASPDHNAILNALTMERVTGPLDADNDNVPDEWEKLFFGATTETGAADFDQDGLSNADEYRLGTNPLVKDSDRDGLSDSEEVTAKTNPIARDSDGDGLSDGDEIKTHKTDPTKADSDSDGLNDGAEVLTYNTDPFKADTDGDGASDGVEVARGTDPKKAVAPTKVSNIVIQSFSGGDPGEGLDLQGNFKYALNISSAGAAGKAGDADFTADNIPGVLVVAANNIPAWNTPEYGDSAADNVVEKVTSSIRYDTRWRVELSGLVPGSTYKLQLLFYEQCCAGRGFNVTVDGVLVAEGFLPADIQGGVNNTAAGVVIAADILTQDDKMIIIGDGPAARAAFPDTINDTNAILDGVTLEVLSETRPPSVSIARAQGNVVITFDGALQSADSVTGPYTDVSGSSPLTVTPAAGNKFYRSIRR